MEHTRSQSLALLLALACAAPLAQAAPAPLVPLDAPRRAVMNTPHAPFKIYGNTYYVGTQGLTAVLITSDFGHVLIDGGLPESAPQIAANIATLGFKIGDVKAILNTHVHFDHAGGIAELQRLSGAAVYVRRPSEAVLRTGKTGADDPQAAMKGPQVPAVGTLWIVSDQQLLGVGSNRLQAIATPGHTPGGTSWTWEACEGTNCLKLVFADSLSPMAGPGFLFGNSKTHPAVLTDFEQAFSRLETLPCDVLITPTPEGSNLFERIAQREATPGASLKQPEACKAYAKAGRAALATRLAEEGPAR